MEESQWESYPSLQESLTKAGAHREKYLVDFFTVDSNGTVKSFLALKPRVLFAFMGHDDRVGLFELEEDFTFEQAVDNVGAINITGTNLWSRKGAYGRLLLDGNPTQGEGPSPCPYRLHG